MNALELYCGTKSFGKVAVEKKYEVVSLDIDEKHEPTICEDILTWDYTTYEPGYFKIIWASPDCTSWSIATHRHRTLKDGLIPKTPTAVLGNKLIHKTLEIIEYFQPEYYFIENPRGRLRHFPPMIELPYRTTVYYSNYGHCAHKATDIWSNIQLWEEKKDKTLTGLSFNNLKRDKTNRSVVPAKLIEKILSCTCI